MKPAYTFITGHTGGLGGRLSAELDPKYTIGISRTMLNDVPYKQLSADLKYPSFFNPAADAFAKNQRINLVLCAATLGKSGGIENADFDDWEETISVNLIGNCALIKSLIPQMIRSGYGRIVFVAGGGAAYGYPLFSGYSLSKVAIVREVENIALEMKDKIPNFSIIALAPGAMETRMLEKVREAGAEVRTTVEIQEPVNFIKNFLSMDKKRAVPLSGKFIHVRDNLSSKKKKKLWLLRRTE